MDPIIQLGRSFFRVSLLVLAPSPEEKRGVTAAMAADSPKVTYPFFTLSDSTTFRFGFCGSSEKSLPPPPPSVEVHLSEACMVESPNVDSVFIVDGLTLLKGRVSTNDVFGVSDSDLIPGKYEGGLKLWEGSIDLVKALKSEIDLAKISLSGKRVLELGCGHSLPGIFAGRNDAGAVHFQDFNAEVLKHLTIPNVKYNLPNGSFGQEDTGSDLTKQTEEHKSLDVRFFAGDWREVHHLLVPGCEDKNNLKQCERYDVILMAETVYSLSTIHHLYDLMKKCLCHPCGVVYLAGKKHYFGVGGGTRRFLHVVNEDSAMEASLLAEVADGSSNVREVWKITFKPTHCG